MNFVDKAFSNDEQKAFNGLENSLIDLKIDFNEPTTGKFKTENPVMNNKLFLNTNQADDYKQFNGNLIDNHSNGQPSSDQLNVKSNSNQLNCINSNPISQSYEYAKIANEFFRENDVYTAITYYTKSIELNPNEGRFYVNRSICKQQANRINEALEDANHATSLMQNCRKPLIRKAEIYQSLNKFNDAEIILNYALKLKNPLDDIPNQLVQEEIQKLKKEVLTKCGINQSIINQTNHCVSIEDALDYAFSKQMEEKLNSQHKFVIARTGNNIVDHNYRNYASSFIRSDENPLYNHQRSMIVPISKSLDSQETIDYLTDEEVNTPNRKLSVNEEIFTFNVQSSSLKKDSISFTFNQLETAKHLLQLNNQNLICEQANGNLIENSSSLANLNNSRRTSTIGIPIMNRNRKRNSISLCEPNSFHNFDSVIQRRFYSGDESPIYSKSLGSNLGFINKNLIDVDPKYKEAVERANVCTNLVGYKALWLGNVSSSCSRERLISIFKRYGEPIVHQLKQSPCVFIKFNNEKSPRDAIQDLHGKVLPDIVHNKSEPVRLHYECNRRQQEEGFPSNKMPRVYSNGECYFFRTVGCSLGLDDKRRSSSRG